MRRSPAVGRLLTCLAAALLAAPVTAAPRPSGELDPVVLEMWQDPAFQRRFTESYIAETEIEPTLTADEREDMQKIMQLITAEKVDKAVELLEKKRNAAATAVFDFTLANIHFQRDQLEVAAVFYEVAVDKHPKFRRAWRNLGLIRVRLGEHDKALVALGKVVELGGGDAITYGLLGYAYANVEDSLAAESAYRMAILLDPATLDWRMGLARSLFRQERYADAAALLAKLIEDDPNRADLWLLQANAFLGLGRPLKAAENYELVDRLGASTPESLSMLADIYINEDLFDLAVRSYIRAMEMNPEGKPDRAIRAAKVMAARGGTEETSRLIDTLEAIHGERMETAERKDLLKLQARLAVAEGAGEEEARLLEEITALDPLDGEAFILLGQHYRRIDEDEKAVFAFERAASIDGFEADAKVRHAQLLVARGKYDEALPLLRRAQQLDPRDNVHEYLEQVERVARGN